MERDVVAYSGGPLILVGAGGLAREIHSSLRRDGEPDVRIVLAEPAPPVGFLRLVGAKRSGSSDELGSFGGDYSFIVAVGDAHARARLLKAGVDRGLDPASVIDSTVVVGEEVELSPGTLVLPQVSLTACATVGEGSLLNPHVSISHGCEVGSFVNIGPGGVLCGNVTLGDYASIGAGATVLPGVRIGSGSVVGAGAVVVDDVPDHVTVAGVPARTVHGDSKHLGQ